MKVAGKPVSVGVGVFFIAFALIGAAIILSNAKAASSPLLFVCVFGGLFAVIPAVLGLGIVYEHLRKANHNTEHR
jgi:cytochrome bd-type quinol oxidase subunit 1